MVFSGSPAISAVPARKSEYVTSLRNALPSPASLFVFTEFFTCPNCGLIRHDHPRLPPGAVSCRMGMRLSDTSTPEFTKRPLFTV